MDAGKLLEDIERQILASAPPGTTPAQLRAFIHRKGPELVQALLAKRGRGQLQHTRARRRVISYGGGLDSFVMLLLAIEYGERIDAVAFCDVADPAHRDPGEWPGTYRHMVEVVIPLCQQHGIPFVWIDTTAYPVRDARSLFAWMWKRGQIPVAGPDRLCTIIGKVERFEAWLDDRFPDEEVEVWVGFEAGEEGRSEKDPNAGTGRKSKPGQARRLNRFPLMEVGFCRCRAEAYCRRSGYPVPRKSACVYCPYGTRGDWQEFAETQPEHFDLVARLEERKPPTKRGLKLSIMGFRAIKNAAGEVLGYHAPPLREWIQGTYRPKRLACKVCGAAVRASKATGCGYLAPAERRAA